jgi:hypothetical protein
MNRLSRLFVFAVLGACAGSPRANAPVSPQGTYPPRDLADRKPQTRPEVTNFMETSSHADVMAFVGSLLQNNKDIHVTNIGKSSQGRDLPLVIMSRPLVRTPAEAKRLARPIVLVQGNIHGGEVEGKEALLALLRDLQLDPYKNVLDSIVLLAVPIYNADGNDALGAQVRNRGAQNGPEQIGQRPNGQNLDLNRDYIKHEAPETRAALKVFNEWEPDVFVDLHTTNGVYHGYGLTYSPPLHPAARFSGPFTRDTILPVLADLLRRNRRLLTFPYGNWGGRDTLNRTWATYDHRPRFGTNYYGLRGRISVLSEAYSHDPFKKRIASTYAFVHDLLSLLGANAEDVMDIGRDADRLTTGYASTANSSPLIPIRARLTQSPAMGEVLVEEVTRAPGDTVRYEAGTPPGTKRTGKFRAVRMPIVDRFEGTLDQTLPYAWVIKPEQAKIVDALRMHGVVVEQMAERGVVTVRRFTIDSIARPANAFQGHQETTLSGRWASADTATLDAGTFVVRGGQSLGILALILLEPQSDDGLTTWNFMDAWLQVGGTHPILRVTEPITTPLRGIRDN